MKKKLKNEIFKEIEKEDHYQNKLNKVKYNMNFAQPKKPKKGSSFWVPILCSASAALFVAIFVPTYIAVHDFNLENENRTSQIGGIELNGSAATGLSDTIADNGNEQTSYSDILDNFTGLNVESIDISQGRSVTMGNSNFEFYPCVVESTLSALAFKVTPNEGQSFEKDSLSIYIGETNTPSSVFYSAEEAEADSEVGYVIVDVSKGENQTISIVYYEEYYRFSMTF